MFQAELAICLPNISTEFHTTSRDTNLTSTISQSRACRTRLEFTYPQKRTLKHAQHASDTSLTINNYRYTLLCKLGYGIITTF